MNKTKQKITAFFSFKRKLCINVYVMYIYVYIAATKEHTANV